MSDRAEFYRKFPIMSKQTILREPVMIPHPSAKPNFMWGYRNTPDYKMWILFIPDNLQRRNYGALMGVRFMVWFDDHGNFVEANGASHVFRDMYCFFDFLDGRDHEGEVCRGAVRSLAL